MAPKFVDETTGRYLPILYPEEKPFWDGTRAHKLVLQRCKSCGKIWYPIGGMCPFCQSSDFEWAQMSGRGKVHNRVIVHKPWTEYFKTRVPYAVVQVEIEEGPRLTTNLFDIPFDKIKIGMSVEATYEKLNDEITLLQFRPAR
jgi:uncharacterized OB-fold protein